MRQGQAEKRAAILRGARKVFGRDGYTRTSIESIAKEAVVSTRTIYNHFPGGKVQLFRAVVVEGSEPVVEARLDAIDRRLYKVTAAELEQDLVEFVRAWVASSHRFADHFAVVRQMRVESAHLPQEFLTAWRQSGPQRASDALAERFERLAADGLLVTDDPARAARHLLLLTVAEINEQSFHGALPLSDGAEDAIIESGVRAFLQGYAPR
ncbi:TetR/AcrR family transcriptional regulator [Streptomyces sp. NPDC090052]|uniref:TetR/AcrR family transcriptional regulator n=1 Tax=unclassified Streptomyces TaxID=2593676 RepID=UPI0022507666|nr:TetR/AcrR family transcriptional regulator [Streptomyces sp. NBC_01306]MCX4728204.1 TetR/AcrR family transcriptional regulator [Streptomyces sp. NBC_01306]WSX40642.1 TetR/AcrR family transcriptional regulator [Streptomyces sp. NBC_00963]WSX71389.1 TetR/AcrR family transcriptional regulator [Streptomyces sp. NBC_00932]